VSSLVGPAAYSDAFKGLPCNEAGEFLPLGSEPPPWPHRAQDDYSPFPDQPSFSLVDLLYSKIQCSGKNIDNLCEILGAYLSKNADLDGPFQNAQDIYNTIDSIALGDIVWQSFEIGHPGPVDPDDPAPWKHAKYEVWFRDPRLVLQQILSNREFDGKIDFCPKVVVDGNEQRVYQDFMSGNWAWDKAVRSSFHH